MGALSKQSGPRFLYFLDICTGTGSMAKAAEKLGIPFDSIDVVKEFDPTILGSIHAASTHKTAMTKILEKMEEHMKKYKLDSIVGTILVHASPPCTELSRAKTRGAPRKINSAYRCAGKCLSLYEDIKLLEASNPGLKVCFTGENPATSLMWEFARMKRLKEAITSYCAYTNKSERLRGMEYRKDTRFAHDGFVLKLKPKCTWKCASSRIKPNGKKFHVAHCVTGRHAGSLAKAVVNKNVRYAIPQALCRDILKQAFELD